LSSRSPLVSVCIPAYNAAEFLGDTLNCLQKQTYSNLEIIVVDDGSTDNTQQILEGIDDPRFSYYLQENKGASASRNKAFDLSSGEFIKFMDADDLINAECIEKQLNQIIDKPDSVASGKWGRFFKPDTSDFKLATEKIWGKGYSGIDWLVNSLIDAGSNMTQPGIFLIPRNIIDKVGMWNEELDLFDDFEFMTRIIANSQKVYFCENAVLLYRSGLESNLSNKKSDANMLSAFKSLKAGIQTILEKRDDADSRLACANTCQRWAFEFYPHHLDLFNKTEIEIRKLGGATINSGGGKTFLLLTKLIGWQKAKRLKIYVTDVLT
jgi:glycosyltransferase involved in cell wall biosynthesis